MVARLFVVSLLITVGALTGCSNATVTVGGIEASINSVLSEWTVQDGTSGGGHSYAYAVGVDSSGNTYTTGYTGVALDGQTQHGGYDFFITKYNSSGVRQWTVQDGATSGYTMAHSLVLDSAGNVYVAGSTSKAIDSQIQHGAYDLFITKYNASGVRQWTVQDGATSGATVAYGLVIDTSGNLYVTGSTSIGIESYSTIGALDLFISKYNSSGAWQWTAEDGAASSSTIGYGVTTDSSGNVYVTGSTTKAIDSQTLHGEQDLFITKYSSSGTRQWTVEDGATSGDVIGNSITTDSSGNIYAAGSTTKAIDGQTLHGTEDLFLTKYNSSGTLQWTVEDGSTSGTTLAQSVVIDAAGSIYFAGNTTKSIDGQTQHGSDDLLISKYNSSGTRQWTYQDGASSGTTTGVGIATNSSGYIYVSGSTNVGLDGQSQHGTNDFFIMQKNAAAP